MSYKRRFIAYTHEIVPPLTGKLLQHTHSGLIERVLNRAFNQVFKTELLEGSLDFFDGKKLHVFIRDISFDFYLFKTSNRLNVTLETMESDVEFSATGTDFLKLITQDVDPDTLFFQRKLKISGDTELGLEIKNFIASIEPQEKLPPLIYRALKSTSHIFNENS